MRRTKSLDDLPNTFQSLDDIPQGIRVPKSKSGSSTSLDKNPVDHVGGLDVAIEKQHRRDSVKPNHLHDPNRAVEVPLGGFVSDRHPINLRDVAGIWPNFKINHPKAAKAAKWTAWFIGAAATTGGSVLFSEELKKMYWKHETNITNESLERKIDIVTIEFEKLLNDSFREFEQRPSPVIFDL